ncbi:acetoin utilization protein AcuB [Arsukibacterium tuosuense]|uniref:Acetoin utilization protein AcuB n=1 Tax=Arsukibacterium tuosuense TaxID=1323745 RepID=A0A285IDH1_9GAMM|nr:CBS domain-containing protein [Arsukibacterium tuosuense]SNY46024.1 acetoin utilization protein AcuB [Arsukibacterium tuosuense]
MSLASIMTRKVQVTTEGATLASLRTLFIEAKFQHVPVVNSLQQPIGIVSVKDYFKAVSSVMDTASESTIELYMQKRKVSQVMSSPVFSVPQDTGILQAASILVERNISCLLVIDSQKKLIGIVSWKDIMRRIVQAQQKKQQQPEQKK